MQGQLEARAGLLAEFLASQSELAILVRNRPELQRACVTALSSEDLLYVVITDASGDVLAQAARPGFPMTAIPARRPAAGSSTSAAIFEGPPPYRKFIDVAKPVSTREDAQVLDWDIPTATGASLGVVRVGFSMAKQRTLLVRTVNNGLTVAAVALMLILAVHYIQLRRILKPLNDLVGFTRTVAAGDLKQRAPVASLEEIYDLGVAFNDMVAELDLTADIGIALTQGDSLQTTLEHCAEVIVRHLDVALAQIWTLREGENLLELQASAGMCADMDGARCPRAGRRAQNRPHRGATPAACHQRGNRVIPRWRTKTGPAGRAWWRSPDTLSSSSAGWWESRQCSRVRRWPKTASNLWRQGLTSWLRVSSANAPRRRSASQRSGSASPRSTAATWSGHGTCVTNQIRTSGALERMLASPNDAPRNL